MTDHFIDIYTHQADAYHRLITPEDADHNLLPALERITSFQGKRVLDLGTGTGRLPLLVGRQAGQMICLDLHGGMLRENQRQRSRQQGRWHLTQADMRALPLPDAWAEVITAGWAIAHVTGWYGDAWQMQAGRILREMHRLVAPGGALIIIETLTTGSLTPAPPNERLAQYYTWLEQEWDFARQEISTDYQFASVEEAVAQTEFFFGPKLAAAIREKGWSRLPEWTGVWGKQV
jgi:ubiquinone/menaquinone biosynthesis C-methylase UbiE